MLFLMRYQHCQGTEGNSLLHVRVSEKLKSGHMITTAPVFHIILVGYMEFEKEGLSTHLS